MKGIKERRTEKIERKEKADEEREISSNEIALTNNGNDKLNERSFSAILQTALPSFHFNYYYLYLFNFNYLILII